MFGGYGRSVLSLLWAFLGATRSVFRTQRELALENLALRQQVALLIRTRGVRRLRLGVWDRTLWGILSQRWAGWRNALAIVEPASVVCLHREGFRRFWRSRSRRGRLGRPGLDREVVNLIRRMAQANVTWGAPRIRNELEKLGIELAVSTEAKYMPRRRKPASPTWRAFLENHLRDLVAWAPLSLLLARGRVGRLRDGPPGSCVPTTSGPARPLWPPLPRMSLTRRELVLRSRRPILVHDTASNCGDRQELLTSAHRGTPSALAVITLST